MDNYKPEDTDFITGLGADAPKFNVHGVPDDIRERMKPAKTWDWRLNGNELSCETDLGPMTQTIPPSYICLGTDESGKPILKKIKL